MKQLHEIEETPQLRGTAMTTIETYMICLKMWPVNLLSRSDNIPEKKEEIFISAITARDQKHLSLNQKSSIRPKFNSLA